MFVRPSTPMLSTPLASAEQLVAQGIASMRAGNSAQARVLFCEAIQIAPDNVMAWLWLSGAVATDAERRYCLEYVLGLDSAHAVARRGLEQLPPGSAAVSPFAIAEPAHAMPISAATAAVPVSALDTVLEPTTPVGSSSESSVPVPALADHDHILGLLSAAPAFA